MSRSLLPWMKYKKREYDAGRNCIINNNKYKQSILIEFKSNFLTRRHPSCFTLKSQLTWHHHCHRRQHAVHFPTTRGSSTWPSGPLRTESCTQQKDAEAVRHSVPSLVDRLTISLPRALTQMNGPNVNSCVFAYVEETWKSEGQRASIHARPFMVNRQHSEDKQSVCTEPCLPSFKAN